MDLILLTVTCVIAALLLGGIGGMILGRVGRASCPKCGGRLTCAFHDTVSREVQRTGYPTAGGEAVFHPFEGYGLSGPGRATR